MPEPAFGGRSLGPRFRLDPARVLQVAAALPSTGSPGRGLLTLAELIGRALGAYSATLSVRPELGEPEQYRWPDANGLMPPAFRLDLPVHHRGELVGALRLELPPDLADAGADAWAGELSDLVGALGVVLANAGAQLQLRGVRHRTRADTALITDARQRAAAEMEGERYALERDLHDGAQHHLVALRMTIALLEHDLSTGDPQAARDRLDRLTEQLDRTEELVATTAAGVLPVPLVAEGLVPALVARLGGSDGLRFVVDPPGSAHRYPAAVESAIYFACLEAVSNAHRHAAGAVVTVTVKHSARGLSFEVADTGPGFDDAAESGLHHLAARLSAVGGSLEVHSSYREGTRVTGFVAI